MSDSQELVTVRLTRRQAMFAAEAIDNEVRRLNVKNAEKRMKHPPMAFLSHTAKTIRDAAARSVTQGDGR